MSDDEDPVPNQLLQPISTHRSQDGQIDISMNSNKATVAKRPYQISFASREDEINYTRKLKSLFATFDGNPDRLMSWLEDTGKIIRDKNYPEMDHQFIIRHLLIGDTLTEYRGHDDMIFNFYDLRRLFLHKNKVLSPLRTMSTLNAISSNGIMNETSPFTSTHLER